MKVGDYVKPNDVFYLFWNCESFSVKIVEITESGIVYFDQEIETISKIRDEGDKSNFFHKCYLKLDTQKMRKEKLNHIHESNLHS